MHKVLLATAALASAAAVAAVAHAQTGTPGASKAAAAAKSAAAVAYPAGYRNWVHVKSMLIDKGHPLFDAFGGIHHIYANTPAVRGYRAGKFPDGAVLVFDLLEAKATSDKAVVEGDRKVLGVMVKSAKRYAATGGWGYEAFKGDSQTERVVGAKAAEACHACHTAQKEKDFVFSAFRK